MNFRQVEAFKALVEHGTVRRAAQVLGISQPAASKLLANLQRGTRVELFTREKQRLRISPEGQILYREIVRSFFGLAHLRRVTSEIERFGTGHLSIGMIHAVSAGLGPQAVAAFSAEFPDVRITIESRSGLDLLAMIDTGRIDLAIVVFPDQPQTRKIELLRSIDAVCVLPPGHALARKKVVTPTDLRNQPFVSLTAGTIDRDRIDRVFASWCCAGPASRWFTPSQPRITGRRDW